MLLPPDEVVYERWEKGEDFNAQFAIMKQLVSMNCSPCRAGSPTLPDKEISQFLSQIPEWKLVDRDDILRIRRSFSFKDFVTALAFTNKVGEVAEAEGHHPSLETAWGEVTVTWWTHTIKGLHQNDFIMAAKTDGIYQAL